MEDVFVEKLVTRKLGGKELLVKLGAVAMVAFVAGASFLLPILRPVSAFVIVGAGWLGWILWSRSNVEYEYSLSNGELTIDGIYGQQKRKNIITVSARERLELMAPVAADYQSEMNRQAARMVDVASSPNAPGRWFMNINGETGLTRVFFEPDDKMVSAMRRAAPSKVKGQ